MEVVIGEDLAVGKERRLRLEHAQIMSHDDGGASAPNVKSCNAELSPF